MIFDPGLPVRSRWIWTALPVATTVQRAVFRLQDPRDARLRQDRPYSPFRRRPGLLETEKLALHLLDRDVVIPVEDAPIG